jgi:hypothetical protein
MPRHKARSGILFAARLHSSPTGCPTSSPLICRSRDRGIIGDRAESASTGRDSRSRGAPRDSAIPSALAIRIASPFPLLVRCLDEPFAAVIVAVCPRR